MSGLHGLEGRKKCRRKGPASLLLCWLAGPLFEYRMRFQENIDVCFWIAAESSVGVMLVPAEHHAYRTRCSSPDQVVWQRDGRGLYFVDPIGRLRKVSMRDADGVLLFGTPVELPVTIGSGHSNTQYDVAPDGRIYYLDPTTLPLPTEIRFVLGWQSLLK